MERRFGRARPASLQLDLSTDRLASAWVAQGGGSINCTHVSISAPIPLPTTPPKSSCLILISGEILGPHFHTRLFVTWDINRECIGFTLVFLSLGSEKGYATVESRRLAQPANGFWTGGQWKSDELESAGSNGMRLLLLTAW